VYKGLFVDRFNDNSLRIAPCCQSSSSIEPTETFNFETSPYLTELRDQFSQGKKPSACNRCWEAERLGHKSRRQSSIDFFQLPQADTAVELMRLDHSATWACNLACIMCDPRNSSTWAVELKTPKSQLRSMGRQFQKNNNFIKQLDLTKIKKIHFNGGEPMLNNDQLDLLEVLDQNNLLSGISISYNTNGTVMPSEQLVNYWKKARIVKLFFSIDGTDKSFEYIRYPASWEATSNNIITMRDMLPTNVMFGINATAACYNIFELCNVWSWFEQNLIDKREHDQGDFCWQFAYNYDIAWLTKEVKERALLQIEPIKALSGIAEYLKTTINNGPVRQWINDLTQIDVRRGTNWKDSLQVGKYY
jgi:hypothetical protein